MMRKKTLAAALVLALVAAVVPALRGQSTGPVRYMHDDLGRLIKVVDQNGNVATYSGVYPERSRRDAVGNLLSITRTGLSSPTAVAIFGFTPGQGPIGATVTTPAGGLSTLLLDTR